MIPTIVILCAVVITLLVINHFLRSDLNYYVHLSEQHLGLYQDASERLADLAESRNVDGERLAKQADTIVKLRRHCLQVKGQLLPWVRLLQPMLDGLTECDVPAPQFQCPKCNCLWRDNADNTMSLADENQKSCEFCEHAPAKELTIRSNE